MIGWGGAKGLTLGLKGLGIVEEVQPEIEQRCRDWLAIYRHVSFIQVPTARSEFEGEEEGEGLIVVETKERRRGRGGR